MANALLDFTIQNGVEVIQKYLVKGHSQMEGDSVHASIERKLKKRDIYLPSNFIKATKKPCPYDADFFKD